MIYRVMKSDAEWRQILTPEQFKITRGKGTEKPFTGQFWNHAQRGTYRCVCCGADLFGWESKFDSGTGWPSFSGPIRTEAVRLEAENSYFLRRTEVLCNRCDAHLGHVFDDGPEPAGLRFCINSAALKFAREELISS